MKRLGTTNFVLLTCITLLFPIFPVFGWVLYDGSYRSISDAEIDAESILSTSEDEDGALSQLPVTSRSRDWTQRTAIQTYVVLDGDTLGQLAADFWLNRNTIRWSNNFSGNTLKVGQTLLIPPWDGLIYTPLATENTDAIAQKFKISAQKIRESNTLPLPSAASKSLYLPWAQPIAPPVTPAAASTSNNKPYSLTLINKNGAGFVPGQCTYFVAKYWPVKWRGHARYWFKNAANAGYKTGQIAKPWAIVVWYGPGYNLRYGHVAIVMSVNTKAGTMIIQDMNYAGPWKVTTRVEKIHNKYIVWFIYNEKK